MKRLLCILFGHKLEWEGPGFSVLACQRCKLSFDARMPTES
jgi:hypothetical protein